MSIWRLIKAKLLPHEQAELYTAQFLLEKIRKEEKRLQSLSDGKMKEEILLLKKRALKVYSLDALLVETFALVSEISYRTLGMRPFDVQIIGAIVLHRGQIAEMKTGEGKTLVATLPLCLNALHGKGAHLVTVNDYLAKRDSEWMRPVFDFMDLSVGVVTEDMDDDDYDSRRRASYFCDITYVTNHELVFDYLRDHLVLSSDEIVCRNRNYAIIDEVDSLLLDEATTPLIISGPTKNKHDLFKKARSVISKLKENVHYYVDHKRKLAAITEEGYEKIEHLIGFNFQLDPEHLHWNHAIHYTLLAHAVYHRDEDYIVKSGEVQIIDEHSGRVSPDKRYSYGLHEAIEVKERVPVKGEDETLAKVSYQNFFRLYAKLSGMSGTAVSEKEEFSKIYNLRTVRIPTNKRIIRKDYANRIYRTEDEKIDAVVDEVCERQKQLQPVLIGTVTVKDSEKLSRIFKKKRISHHVLNAKNHKKEADIIAQAGKPSAVTISTAMAGRGTDIILGGNPEKLIKTEEIRLKRLFSDKEKEKVFKQWEKDREKVINAGGLAVIGTSLHESRRIDNQLRGRAGRQGDPGYSCYFLSLDDSIYKKFGKRIIPSLKEKYSDHAFGEQIKDRSLEKKLGDLCQKIENENRATRVEVFKYDSVVNRQRKVIYNWRDTLIMLSSSQDSIFTDDLLEQISDDIISSFHISEQHQTNEVYTDLQIFMKHTFNLSHVAAFSEVEESLDYSYIKSEVKKNLEKKIEQLKNEKGVNELIQIERQALLITIDEIWTNHLNELEELEEGIGLRSYGEKDPLLEYAREAKDLFNKNIMEIRINALSKICHMSE